MNSPSACKRGAKVEPVGCKIRCSGKNQPGKGKDGCVLPFPMVIFEGNCFS